MSVDDSKFKNYTLSLMIHSLTELDEDIYSCVISSNGKEYIHNIIVQIVRLTTNSSTIQGKKIHSSFDILLFAVLLHFIMLLFLTETEELTVATMLNAPSSISILVTVIIVLSIIVSLLISIVVLFVVVMSCVKCRRRDVSSPSDHIYEQPMDVEDINLKQSANASHDPYVMTECNAYNI